MKYAIIFLMLTSVLIAQNLYLPHIERYLFTATADGAEAFRFNPASLGFKHLLNSSIYIFTPSKFNRVGQRYDIGLFLQHKGTALLIRRALSKSDGSILISTGIGFGQPDITFGMGFDWFKLDSDRKFRTVINAGLICRPLKFMSLGAVIQNLNNEPLFRGTSLETQYKLGLAVRPFGNDRITISGDAIYRNGFNFKFGIDLKILDGLKIFAIADDSKLYSDEMTYLFGLSFNLSSSGVKISSDVSSSYEGTLVSLISSREFLPTSFYPKKRIAEVTIRGIIPDYKEKPSLFSRPRRNLHDIVDELERAARDRDINGVILKVYPFSGELKLYEVEGITQELAEAIQKIKDAGKPVVAYLSGQLFSVNELYLASCADKIVIPPGGIIYGYGVNLNVLRLKKFFEKFGVEWDAMTAGKYKSTFHSIYTDSATPYQAELVQGIVDEVHRQIIEHIARWRNINITDEVIDKLSGMLTPPEAKELGIIDNIGFYKEAKKVINKLANNRDDEKIQTVKLSKRRYWDTYWGIQPKVAVIGVYGSIVPGESQPPNPFSPFGERVTGSETVVRQIRSAMRDKSVKAIILRVDSPGGSALASEEIWSALKEAREKKPVIVSFANIAASGGYYVASSSDRIFANPATLTGSIGVVISKPVISKLYQKLKINIETYKRGEQSDMFSSTRHFTDKEWENVKETLEYFYIGFKEKVAENRNMTLEEVEELAQGKVYTGTQALKLNLIDELGGLNKAIEYARKKAGIEDKFKVKYYRVPSFFEIPTGINVLREILSFILIF